MRRSRSAFATSPPEDFASASPFSASSFGRSLAEPKTTIVSSIFISSKRASGSRYSARIRMGRAVRLWIQERFSYAFTAR